MQQVEAHEVKSRTLEVRDLVDLLWGKKGKKEKFYKKISEETSQDTRTSAEHDAKFYSRKETYLFFFKINECDEHVCRYELHYGMKRFDVGVALLTKLFLFSLSLFFFVSLSTTRLPRFTNVHPEKVSLQAKYVMVKASKLGPNSIYLGRQVENLFHPTLYAGLFQVDSNKKKSFPRSGIISHVPLNKHTHILISHVPLHKHTHQQTYTGTFPLLYRLLVTNSHGRKKN